MTDHHPAQVHPAPAQAAPGWYPDATGGQRWWDGYGWTEHTAPAAAPAASVADRPPLPEGARIDTVWVWLVALVTLVSAIPMFFFDMTGYMRTLIEAELSGSTGGIPSGMGGYLVLIGVTQLLGWASWGLTIFAAFRDYKHLTAIGVVRPFHWAFAFIPYTIVYLIGRHVVLRKVSRTAGWPLWGHIAGYVVVIIAAIVWTVVMTQALLTDVIGYTAG